MQKNQVNSPQKIIIFIGNVDYYKQSNIKHYVYSAFNL
jgi:hypothetical protein